VRRHAALLALSASFVVVLGSGAYLAYRRELRLGTVRHLMGQAWLKWGQAQGAREGNLRPWDDAIKTAKSAVRLSENWLLVDPLTREKAQNLQTDIENERLMAEHSAGVAKKDRRLAEMIAELRTLQGGPFDEGADPDPLYTKGFREAGHDPQDSDPRTSRKNVGWVQSRGGETGTLVVLGLEDWSARRRVRGTGAWKPLLDLADRGDQDLNRHRLRTALRDGDRATMEKLARAANLDRLTPAAAIELSRIRADALDDAKGAIAVLRIAALRFPNDAWVQFELADQLRRSSASPSDVAEAIRYYTAARALKPETAHALAHVLEGQGRTDEAIALFRDLARRRAAVGRHRLCLAALLKARGQQAAARSELDAAIATLRKALKANPVDSIAHCDLALALREKGDSAAAQAEFREALRLNPKDERTQKTSGEEALPKGA
jgi:tetratricopeptide (TPR) repeat protein